MSDVTSRQAVVTQGGIHEAIGVIGYFDNPDALRAGMEHVRNARVADAEVYTPIPDLSTLEIFYPWSSPARWVALAGGLTGIAAALTMTIWMSWDYPLIVGGKPITAIPPFMVVAFELMVLFGSIAAVLGFLWFSRLPDLTPSAAYRPSMAINDFTIYIPGADSAARARAEQVLREAGAVDVATVHDTPRARLQVLK